MMTTELTHEQAARLRYNIDFLSIDSAPEELWGCFETNDIDYIVGLSAYGLEALAHYDAKWCLVPRRSLADVLELAELQNDSYYESDVTPALKELSDLSECRDPEDPEWVQAWAEANRVRSSVTSTYAIGAVSIARTEKCLGEIPENDSMTSTPKSRKPTRDLTAEEKLVLGKLRVVYDAYVDLPNSSEEAFQKFQLAIYEVERIILARASHL